MADLDECIVDASATNVLRSDSSTSVGNLADTATSSSSSISSVDTTPTDLASTRRAWQERTRRDSVDLGTNGGLSASSSSSPSKNKSQQHHRRRSSSIGMATVSTSDPTLPNAELDSLRRLLANMPAEQIQQLLLTKQQQPSSSPLAPSSSLPASAAAASASALVEQSPSLSTSNGKHGATTVGNGGVHHRHGASQQRKETTSVATTTPSSLSSGGGGGKPSTGAALLGLCQNVAFMIAFAFLTITLTFAIGTQPLGFWRRAAPPPLVNTVAYRMAHTLESDFCVSVMPDEVRTGKAQGGQVDLRALRQTMIVHMNANGLRGMCTQHLEGAPPVCQCVLRLTQPFADGKLSQGRDSDFIDLYNLDVGHVSEDLVFFVRERNIFCPTQFWIERYLLCRARYMDGDGVYYTAKFNGTDAGIVQNLYELHRGYSFCTIDGQQVLLRKMRDKHLYGKDITPQWNAHAVSVARMDAPPPRQLAPDQSPVYRSVSLHKDWGMIDPSKRSSQTQQKKSQS